MRFQANIVSLQQSPQLYRLNQNTAQIADDIKPEQGKKNGRYDSATISPVGKAMNRMQSLMEQKESLNQRKHELIEKTLEGGGNLKDIQEQLESFETSMEAIDEQVSSLMEDALKVENKDGEKKGEKQDIQTPKSEEEAQAQQLGAVVSVAGNLETMKVAMSTKTKMQGRINTLEQEIKLDQVQRVAHGETLSVSTKKGDEIKALEERIENVQETMGEAMSEAHKAGNEQNGAAQLSPQDENTDNAHSEEQTQVQEE